MLIQQVRELQSDGPVQLDECQAVLERTVQVQVFTGVWDRLIDQVKRSTSEQFRQTHRGPRRWLDSFQTVRLHFTGSDFAGTDLQFGCKRLGTDLRFGRKRLGTARHTEVKLLRVLGTADRNTSKMLASTSTKLVLDRFKNVLTI